MTDLTFQPAQTLLDVSRTFRVDKPLDAKDPRYVDLKSGRGDDARGRLRRALNGKQPGEWLFAALASHRGAGKTTELIRLREEVGVKFHGLQIEANVELNSHELVLEELLLVLCKLVTEEMSRIKLPLDAALLKEVEGWFAQITKESKVSQLYQQELQVGASAGHDYAPLGLIGRLTSLIRSSSEHRVELKEVLRRYPGTLLDATNKLLMEAHKRLRADKKKRELLVIIDNMDRYPPSNIDALLVQGGDTLKQLACNVIVTPPLMLVYKPASGNLDDHFRVEVMPAFRLRDKGSSYDSVRDPARNTLDEVLRHRLNLHTIFPDPAVRDRLYTASGGAVRELIELVGEVSLEQDEGPIPLDVVERVVKRKKGRLRTQINLNGWAPTLARIAREKTVHNDPRCLDLLFLRLVFEYNGEVWHDIHPLVAEIEEVKAALAQASP